MTPIVIMTLVIATIFLISLRKIYRNYVKIEEYTHNIPEHNTNMLQFFIWTVLATLCFVSLMFKVALIFMV